MGNGKKGLGISNASSALISPCPSMIDRYFKDQLKYNKVGLEYENDNQYLVRYMKPLNQMDHPLFPDLAGLECTSFIVINMYNGSIIDQYFKVNKGRAIRIYSECPSLANLVTVFQWHLNLVRMIREYIKGGWMQRKAIQKEIEAVKDRYIILNKKGFDNILEKAKPEGLATKVDTPA